MKKLLVFLMILTLTLSVSLSAFAASDKSQGKGNGSEKSTTVQTDSTNQQKQFKQELNREKKELQSQANVLEKQRTELQTQYDALIAANTAESLAAAALLLPSISDLDTQLADAKAAIKQCINERYMIIKTPYSGEELMAFDSAEALIAQMYTDITEKGLSTITVKNNLIKLEGPVYLKGGKIMFPLQAIENIGATVAWDELAQTVTVTQGSISVVFTVNGTTATSTQAVDMAVATTSLTDDLDSTFSGSLTGTVAGGITGDMLGTIDGTITDPLTGAIEGTVTGTITDPVTLEVSTVSGTVSGFLSDPVFTLDPVVTAVDTPVQTELTCGRAYVPLQSLAEIFALDVTLDTTTGTIAVDPDTTDDDTPTE